MGQGFFESDDEYRARTAREANERTISEISGSEPSQGFFESDSDYAARMSKEASEQRIQAASGSAPSQGVFESDDSYRSRVEREANEHYVATSTGHKPSQSFFESDKAYKVRVRKEANERAIGDATGRGPAQGFFEGDHEYRARIAHEAREAIVQGRTKQVQSTSASAQEASSTPGHADDVAHPRQGEAPGSAIGRLAAIAAALAALYYFLSPTTPQPRPQLAQPTLAPPLMPIDWRAPPKLTLGAFGAFRVGMTYHDAAAVASGPLRREPMQEDDCYFVTPTSAPDGIALMISNGRLARIDITSSAYSSLRGARVGQSQHSVLEMYGGRLEVEDHHYDENGKYLVFTPTDLSDRDYQMIFETNGQTVTRFRAGRLPEVAYVEGCL